MSCQAVYVSSVMTPRNVAFRKSDAQFYQVVVAHLLVDPRTILYDVVPSCCSHQWRQPVIVSPGPGLPVTAESAVLIVTGLGFIVKRGLASPTKTGPKIATTVSVSCSNCFLMIIHS